MDKRIQFDISIIFLLVIISMIIFQNIFPIAIGMVICIIDIYIRTQ